MHNVVIAKTQLLAVVEASRVFYRANLPKGHVETDEEKKIDDRRRYDAWNAADDGDNVFEGVATDGARCFVILHQCELNPFDMPKPAPTQGHDFEVKRLANRRQEQEEKRTKAQQRRDRIAAAFEFIPREHWGVDYGKDQRVLIRTKHQVLTYCPGHTAHYNRFDSTYEEPELAVRSICAETKGARSGLSYRIAPGGGHGTIETPDNFRLCPKHLKGLFKNIEKVMSLKAGTLLKSGWAGEKTLVLK